MKKIKFTISLMSFLFMTVFTFGQEIAVAETMKLKSCNVDELILATDAFQKALVAPTTPPSAPASFLANQLESEGGSLSYQEYVDLVQQGNEVILQTILDFHTAGIYTDDDIIGFFDNWGILDEYQNMVSAGQQVAANCTLNEEQLEQRLKDRALVLFPPRNPGEINQRGFWSSCSGKAILTVTGGALGIVSGCSTGFLCAVAGLSAVVDFISFCTECC